MKRLIFTLALPFSACISISAFAMPTGEAPDKLLIQRLKSESASRPKAKLDVARELFSTAFELYKQAEYRAAATTFAKALEIDPANGLARFYYADSLSRLGDLLEARAQYELSLGLISPATQEAWMAQAALNPIILSKAEFETKVAKVIKENGVSSAAEPTVRSLVQRNMLMVQDMVSRGFLKPQESADPEKIKAAFPLYRQAFKTAYKPSEAKLRAFYEERTSASKEYYVADLIFGAESDAKMAIQRIKSGESFDRVATAMKSAQKASGGDFEWINGYGYPKDYIPQIDSQADGVVSAEPFKLKGYPTFHVAIVRERRKPVYETFESVRSQIENSFFEKNLENYETFLSQRAVVK
ncbi:hypothetical protein AB4Z32_27130 [Massilia sp. 2TAF26]|uniref:peptidylprolyl isomerase n=1 Tax=Massilia sp. 2TAF26 TaxID=3233012 RepID=UPI003F96596A